MNDDFEWYKSFNQSDAYKVKHYNECRTFYMIQKKTMIGSNLSILVGSFNTHKLYPPSDINLSSWITHQSITTPQIIAIGLQELPLTIFQQKSEYIWRKIIEKTLPNYQLLSYVRLNGIILFIYIQSSHFHQCSSIGTAKVPTVNFDFHYFFE